jgi:hypothetical protein
LIATLPNVFKHLNFAILLNIADVIFEVRTQYLRAKTIEFIVFKNYNNHYKIVWQSGTVGHTELTYKDLKLPHTSF